MVIKHTVWRQCYADSWKGLLVSDDALTVRCSTCGKCWQVMRLDTSLPCPKCKAVGTNSIAQLSLFDHQPLSAFEHPAKVSRGLAKRLYEYLRDAYGMPPETTIVDPFAGIGGLALDASLMGYHFIGVELEPRFHTLAEANKAYWRHKFGPQRGSVTFLQGDSRELGKLLGEAGCVLSSPPYAESKTRGAAEIATIPIGARWANGDRVRDDGIENGYGSTTGQLAALPIGALLSSPPYGDQQVGTGADGRTGWRGYTDHAGGTSATPGQLAALPMEALVSSPPYEGSLTPGNKQNSHAYRQDLATANGHGQLGGGQLTHGARYSFAADNLGNPTRETFWAAAHVIIQQCWQVLAPAGLAVWVTKPFVRDGVLVDFPGDWEQLCTHIGFETLEIIEALQVERWSQPTLDGQDQGYKKSHKSFFRTIGEAKGAPPIDAEIILIQRKR